MHVGNPGNQSPLSLLGDSFRSDHDPDAGNVSGRSNAPSSTGATYMGSTRWVNTVVGVADPEHSPNAVALRAKLQQLFEPHITGQNREAFQQLIDQRAIRLNEMGETPESVEATLAKGQKLDRLSQGVVGAARSVPFAIASRLIDTVPGLTAFAKTPQMVGFIAGLFSGAVDTVGGGSGLLKKATSDTQWLTAKPEQLEAVMADAAKAREPGLGRTAAEVTVAFQTYSLRNVLRIGTAAVGADKLSEKGAAELDSWMSAAGGVAAGVASYAGLNAVSEQNHRVGPEYLLGRQDWEAQYTALKEVNPWKDPLINGGKRLLQIPVDATTETLASIRNLGTATNLTLSVGILGGGFAGAVAAKVAATEAAQKAGIGAVGTAAIGQAVNTAVSAPVFGVWTAAAVLGGPVFDKAASLIQEKAGSLLDQAANRLHGRPSGSQPLPSEPHDDTKLETMEGGGQPPSGTNETGDHVVLEIVEEEEGQHHRQPPLNAAERNV